MTLLPSLRDARPRQDLVPALMLAALAIPEQLATARLAGLPAAQGVAVFAAAAVVMVLFARDRALSVGADSSIAPVIAAALAAAAPPGSAALIAAMVGIILCTVAALRLEGIARLLSMPVAAGMMAGIAVHILVGRLPTALGLDVAPSSPIGTLAAIWGEIGAARVEPLALTVLVAGICLLGGRLTRRVPAAFVALAGAAALAAWLDPDATIFARSGESGQTWGLGLPALQPAAALTLLPAALVVAFLCLFQTTVVLRQGSTDTPALRRNALGAVGLSNLAAAAIGGFAVNSSPPRTQILRESGATSQLAGLGAAAIGLAVLLLAPGLLRILPAAALAGVLVWVALHIFPLGPFRLLYRHSPLEAAIAVAAATLVTVLPLQFGLPLAMLLSLLHATLPLFAAQVVELDRIPGTTIWWHRNGIMPTERRDDLMVLGLTSPMNFANAEGIAGEIRGFLARRPVRPELLVLEGAGLLSVDVTGAETLSELVRELRASGTQVALARVESDRAREQLDRSGVIGLLGHDHIFDSVDHAVTKLASHSQGTPVDDR